ncbi:MAG: hypothetical protein IPL83_10850 [Bdellovibrionales bacterium]|nr:hypothetical protein [Bdellovibrionales bacterium]
MNFPLKLIAPFITLGLVLLVCFPGLGSRHLWQDELETAERARSILAFGFPTVIDEEGRPSVNAGGLEIEESALHRYTPWLQFYWAAIGLEVSRRFDFDADIGVRAPFALAHSISSALITHALISYVSLNPAVSIVAGGLYGFQSVRLVHARTSRYHALLDLLFVVFLILIGKIRTNSFAPDKRSGLGLFLLAFLLPQAHTLGGSLLSLIGGLTLLGSFVLNQKSTFHSERLLRRIYPLFKNYGMPMVVGGVISFLVIIILCRPYLQSHWVFFKDTRFRSLRDFPGIRYSIYALIFYISILGFYRKWKWALSLVISLSIVALIIRIFDFIHPFSQSRYYLPITSLFLFWMIPFGLPKVSKKAITLILSICLLGLITPELSARFKPFQGVQLSFYDFMSLKKEDQPLFKAIQKIKRQSQYPLDSSVLLDYVPQFINWYLPGYKVALMPDLATKTKLNSENQIWETIPEMPFWHMSYPGFGRGLWNCGSTCDYQIIEIPEVTDRYILHSQRRDEKIEMCLVDHWPSYQWTNSPFQRLEANAFTPSGANGKTELVLAKRCP